jgi:4-hydroxy-4-methyl-2-oxoglutarate aldolase
MFEAAAHDNRRNRTEDIRMSVEPLLRDEELHALRHLDTCTVSDAIETFQVRLRNAGFADSSIRCIFPDFAPLVGYAATARLRTDEAPMAGRMYHNRTDWWNSLLQVPAPRIAVIEDMDTPPGKGAFLGDMHAAILMAFGCIGYVTNGAVRELARVRKLGFQMFASNVVVSHAYAHIFDFGATIEVGGLQVRPGDLLHGDQHGLLAIPKEIAGKIPAEAARLQEKEEEVIDICRSKKFSVETLRQALKEFT